MHVFVQDVFVDYGGELRVGEVEGRKGWGGEIWEGRYFGDLGGLG